MRAPLPLFLAVVLLTGSCSAKVVDAADGVADIERRAGSVLLTSDDPRPLGAAVLALVRELGLNVSYEDPRYEFAGDLKDVAALYHKGYATAPPGSKPQMLVPRGGRFIVNFPESEDTGAILERVLAAAAHSVPAIRFRIERTEAAWHVVPVGSRDARGTFVARPAILDARISLPDQERTAQQAIDAILAAVSAANHVHVDPGAFSLDGGIVSESGSPKFRLAANDEPARVVLMRAFDAIEKERNVRLTWLLFCGQEPRYVMNLIPVRAD